MRLEATHGPHPDVLTFALAPCPPWSPVQIIRSQSSNSSTSLRRCAFDPPGRAASCIAAPRPLTSRPTNPRPVPPPPPGAPPCPSPQRPLRQLHVLPPGGLRGRTHGPHPRLVGPRGSVLPPALRCAPPTLSLSLSLSLSLHPLAHHPGTPLPAPSPSHNHSTLSPFLARSLARSLALSLALPPSLSLPLSLSPFLSPTPPPPPPSLFLSLTPTPPSPLPLPHTHAPLPPPPLPPTGHAFRLQQGRSRRRHGAPRSLPHPPRQVLTRDTADRVWAVALPGDGQAGVVVCDD